MAFSTIAEHILAGQRAGIEPLLNVPDPAAVWRDEVLPAARTAIARYSRGELILPQVLASLELVHLARQHLGGEAIQPQGTIVVATLPGDVHHIGTALLVTVLENLGYEVVDLGMQVPIDAVLAAAQRCEADAIGLSALLVTSSRHMPACVQALDARGLHIPVLVGGAAINRAFGRRSAILPDGRVYAAGVFYCRDVFEGLTTLDALTDPESRAPAIAQVRREIEAERDTPSPRVASVPTPGAAVSPIADVPTPPYWGPRRRDVDLRAAWHHLERGTLFRFHWGGYRAPEAAYARLVDELMEPWFADLTQDSLREGWLEARVITAYFPCNADGDALVVFDALDSGVELARLEFPRQAEGERLCLSDYFLPIGAGRRDVVALQAVTVGPRAGDLVDQLQRAGEYVRMLLVNGLASATAEALADYAHALARADLGLAANRGLRFSWGYQACPDLDEQRKVLPLLNAAADIGLSLTESDTLSPEHSTVAMVVHHPEAKYFAVR